MVLLGVILISALFIKRSKFFIVPIVICLTLIATNQKSKSDISYSGVFLNQLKIIKEERIYVTSFLLVVPCVIFYRIISEQITSKMELYAGIAIIISIYPIHKILGSLNFDKNYKKYTSDEIEQKIDEIRGRPIEDKDILNSSNAQLNNQQQATSLIQSSMNVATVCPYCAMNLTIPLQGEVLDVFNIGNAISIACPSCHGSFNMTKK